MISRCKRAIEAYCLSLCVNHGEFSSFFFLFYVKRIRLAVAGVRWRRDRRDRDGSARSANPPAPDALLVWFVRFIGS